MPRRNTPRRSAQRRTKHRKKRKKKKAPKNKTRKTKRRKSKAQKEAARKRRRLREETAPGRGVTKDDRKRVFDYYGRKCLKCGTTKRLVLDHVIALYRGGRHDPDNLQPLCYRCNTRKGLQTRDYRPYPFYY